MNLTSSFPHEPSRAISAVRTELLFSGNRFGTVRLRVLAIHIRLQSSTSVHTYETCPEQVVF